MNSHTATRGKRSFIKILQSVSSKSAGHIVAFDFASHGFLASHSVIKKHLSSVLQLSDKEKEKFADYKGRENVFWAAWVRIRTKVVQS